MNILVFVKQIPDTTEVKLDPKTGNLCRDGVASVINPLDLNAIEAATQLKAAHGGRVTAVTMGPPQAREVLLKAMALGCDDAVLLSDRAFGGADTLATAYTLSEAAKKLGQFDLLLFGQHSADGDTAQVGAAVAAFLDIPQVTQAVSLECRDGWAFCDRALRDCGQKVRVKLPAAVMVCDGINEPPYASPRGILAALEKPLAVWDAAALGADPARTGTAGSPSETKRVFAPPKSSGGTEFLSGSPAEIAAGFADMLEKEGLI